MKKIPFLLCLFLLQGCIEVYDLKNRLTVYVKVVDASQSALPNLLVEVYPGNVPNYYYGFGEVLNKGLIYLDDDDGYDLISFGETNANGELTLHFPTSLDGFSAVSLFIKDEANRYKPLQLVARNTDFENNYLSVTNVTLYKLENLVSFQIDVELGENYRLLNYTLDGDVAYNTRNVNELATNPSFEEPWFFSVKKNQTLQLIYTLEFFDGTSFVNVPQEVTIEIGENDATYVIQNP